MRLMCTKLTRLGLFSIPHTSAPPASCSRSKHPVVNGIRKRVFQRLMRNQQVVEP